jgi:outer membrane protein assembly factor BamA
MRLAAAVALACLLPSPAGAQSPAASFVGRTVTGVSVAIEGKPATEPALIELIETATGRPLAMGDVRDTISHLFSLGRFQDIRVEAAEANGGVSLRYALVPVHAVERVEFTGELGLSRSLLRKTVTERFGPRPPASRAADVVRVLLQLYEDRGYQRTTITPRTTELHDPDRAILTFEIGSGPLARIGKVDLTGEPLENGASFLSRIDARPGTVYRHAEIQRKLTDYVRKLREDRRYDAIAVLRPAQLSPDGGVADLTIDVRPGPVMTIAFEGDPIPPDRWDDLVPVEREGSADEDLLEDSARRIEDYLRQQGYWRARATFERRPQDAQVRIVFTVLRGLLYRVAEDVAIAGNTTLPAAELRPLASRLTAGAPFVDAHLNAAAAAIAALYRGRGYAQVKVTTSAAELNPTREGEGLVRPVVSIAEGPITLIDAISFSGNETVSAAELRAVLTSRTGGIFLQANAAADEDAVLLHYYNLGFASANVTLTPRPGNAGRTVELAFEVAEGPRTLVDHVIVVGNRRTDREVIRRELQLRPGEPLGLQDRMESQRRISALGLFRRVSVQPLRHRDDERMDVLVTVEEAPATTVGYGGGLEVSRLLRPTGPDGDAEEHIEFAPRAFFDIGRRNLGGKNRSINLFTRVGVRPDDTIDDPGSRFGFVDYRVVTTYRQPRLWGANDTTVTGAIEQGVRSSFNFARKGATVEANRRLAPGVGIAARYSFSWTKTFDKGIGEEDQARIDRLFPNIRLGQFSGAISRDTRDDLANPTKGTFLSGEGGVAARALGGQVGFVKTYGQAFWFHVVPRMNGTVFATRASLGLADGFKSLVQATDPITGEPIPGVFVEVEDLPASERFYAGGDNSIRGYALDTVGAPLTISPSGFPKGGNAVLILSAELRFPAWKDIAPVVFVDGGNVWARATHFDVTDLQGAVGLGVRYRTPVGPIRLDVGFKLHRRVIAGELERPRAFHLSIGHAF